jgi:hypothetical protein
MSTDFRANRNHDPVVGVNGLDHHTAYRLTHARQADAFIECHAQWPSRVDGEFDGRLIGLGSYRRRCAGDGKESG